MVNPSLKYRKWISLSLRYKEILMYKNSFGMAIYTRVNAIRYSAVQQEIIKMIFVFNVIFLTIGAQKCYILYTKN